MTAEDVKKLLGLKPHPREGGWYVRTYEAGELIAAEAFSDARYGGARRTGTAIYYLLEPETFSEMHRLRSDEVFHFYAGDAVEMLQLREGGSGARTHSHGCAASSTASTASPCRTGSRSRCMRGSRSTTGGR